jgi:hypothetical protein
MEEFHHQNLTITIGRISNIQYRRAISAEKKENTEGTRG